MIKKLDKIDFISIVLISFSIFFWDIQYNFEIPNFQIGLRFIYLINFLIIIFYLKKYLFDQKLISIKFIFYSFLFSLIIYVHYSINLQIIYSNKIFFTSLILFLTILIIKAYHKILLENKIPILKTIIVLSVASYFLSILGFYIFDESFKNFGFEDLMFFVLKPCTEGFYNRFNFIYSESSHFGMISISIYMTTYYYLVKENFKDKTLLVLFIFFFFIILNNMSLTLIMGIFTSQIAILIVCFKKKFLKYIIFSLLMALIFVIILVKNENCRYKLNNAIWLTSQPINFTLSELLGKKVDIRLELDPEPKDEASKLEVSKLQTQVGEVNIRLGKTTDLSSAVLIHNLKIAYHSIFDKPFGWGMNNYYSAFKFYSTTKQLVVHHEYALNVNKEDGSQNLAKITTEFGIFSFILWALYLVFMFSKKVDLSNKIFLFPIIFTQLFLRGAGYFNGGFLVATIIICILLFNKNANSN